MSTLQQIHADPARRVAQFAGSELLLADDQGISKTATAQQVAEYTAALIESTPALQPVVRLNPRQISEDLTIPAGYNAAAVGPLDVAEGVVITVGDHAAFSIL